MLANNTSCEDSFTTCQITPENHGSLLDSLLNIAASITESLLSADCCWLGSFGKVYWPTPFNMHFDFCPLFRITFAEHSRKYPYSQTPAISRGCVEGKANTRRLAVAKPRLWKLGCYLWRVWLSTSTTTQGTEQEPNRNSLVPFSCRTPGSSGWQPFTKWL